MANCDLSNNFTKVNHNTTFDFNYFDGDLVTKWSAGSWKKSQFRALFNIIFM